MSKEKKYNRRNFLESAFMTIGAAEIAMIGFESQRFTCNTLGISSAGNENIHGSFEQLKQIDAGVLNVGYAEAGPVNGQVVILLHGWPYDIHSFIEVTPLLVKAGYRVIIPYQRGYGTTQFLFKETLRNGQQSAFALDTINLMDALKIKKAIVAVDLKIQRLQKGDYC